MKCRMWGILLLVALLAVFCAAGLAEEPLPGVPVEAEEGLYHVIPLNGVPKGATDTDFPVLESFEMSPEGETLKPGDTVTFRVKASDPNGMGEVSLEFWMQEDLLTHTLYTFDLAFNQSTGFWEGSYTFKAEDPPGRWRVTSADLLDRYGMKTWFEGTSFRVMQRFFPGSVWLENPDYVDESPAVTKKSIVSNLQFDCVGAYYTYSEPLEMAFDIPANLYNLNFHINFSGLSGSGGSFMIYNPSNPEADQPIVYDRKTGHVTVTYFIPMEVYNSLYYLSEIHIWYSTDENEDGWSAESLTRFDKTDYPFEFTYGTDQEEKVQYELTDFFCEIDGQTLKAGDTVAFAWQVFPDDDDLEGTLFMDRVSDPSYSDNSITGMQQSDDVSMKQEKAVYDPKTKVFTATHVISEDEVYGTYKIRVMIHRDRKNAVWDESRRNIITPEVTYVHRIFDTNVMFLFDQDPSKTLRRWEPATNVEFNRFGEAKFSVPEDFEGSVQLTLFREGSTSHILAAFRPIKRGDTWQEETGVDLFGMLDSIRRPSGKYYYEITLCGDDKEIFDSPTVRSESVEFKRPVTAVDPPAKAEWDWDEQNNILWVLISTAEGADYVGGYDVQFFYAETPEDTPVRVNSVTSISSWMSPDGYYYAHSDTMLQDYGAGCYYFKVRTKSSDPRFRLSSPWSKLSEPFRVDEITESALTRLNGIPEGLSAGEVRAQVQQISSAELETALLTEEAAAEKLAELEQAIGGGTNVEVKEQVPGVEGRITAVGASLNETVAEGPVKLIVDKPKKQEKLPAGYKEALAVRFSLEPENLKNPKALNVPVLVDMPVPAGMDPDTLVILHYPSSGGAPMVIRPYIYLAGTQTYMQFTLLSFSDFAVTEPLSGNALPGDVNGDGLVDGRDVVRLMNFLAEEIDPETSKIWEINEKNADLNGDETVDGKDLLRLVKMLIGEE